MSSYDIGAGSRWSSDLSHQLESVNFGILCLTAENLSSPWIHFEAGALSKITDKGNVCPYLFDLEFTDLKDPLSQFMAVKADKVGTKKLLHTINKSMGQGSLSMDTINKSFDVFWPDLEKSLSNIPIKDILIKTEKSQDKIIEEALVAARDLSRMITEFKLTDSLVDHEKVIESDLPKVNFSVTLHESEIELLKDITNLYKKVKKLNIEVEEFNDKMAFAPTMLEMRSALDHLMRFFAGKFELKEDADTLYSEENLSKAMTHLYRAGMDSLDYLSVEISRSILYRVEPFSTDSISTIMPEYFRKIRPDMDDISNTISKVRGSKDLGSNASTDMDIYIDSIEKLKKYHLEVLMHINALAEYEKKVNKEASWGIFRKLR